MWIDIQQVKILKEYNKEIEAWVFGYRPIPRDPITGRFIKWKEKK